MKPQLVLLAGPNGAGKTTFYDTFLSKSALPFLNADIIEARTGISSNEAARILDGLRDRLIEERVSFITETVFSDPVGAKLAMLAKAADNGYEVIVIYVGVDPRLATLRVDQRVATGGHDVPRDRILKRFERSLVNLRAAIGVVTSVKIYDNSSSDPSYRLLATFTDGKPTFRAAHVPTWAQPVIGHAKSKRKR